jgi:hypothetical protein
MKTSGLTSVAKVSEATTALSSDKKRKASPLPIQIELVPDNYEPEPEPAFPKPSKMSLGDLLCVDLPKKKKNWRAAIARQVAEEAAQIKHMDLETCSISKKLVSTNCPSANLVSEDPFLGKRKLKPSDWPTYAEICEGIQLGLIRWQHLTFSSKVVEALKKKARQGRKDRERSYTVKTEEIEC